MKTLFSVLLLCASEAAMAIPIYKVIPEGMSTVQVEGAELVGYQQVLTGRHWTWHGRARKYSYTPLYAVSAVPEPSTYGMMLTGLGIVLWKLRRGKSAYVGQLTAIPATHSGVEQSRI